MRWNQHLFNLTVAAALGFHVASAQHVHPQSLPVLVDGSKTPEKISDSLAYSHFFIAVAAHPTPAPEEERRQTAQLLVLDLAPSDRQAFVEALSAFRMKSDELEKNIAQKTSASVNSNTDADITQLRAQQTALVQATIGALRTALSPSAAKRLDDHVKTHVKAHIVIYGTAE